LKTIYFLSLNMIQFVPYAYGFLRSYAQTNEKIKANYIWKDPFCRIEPVDTIVSKIEKPDLLFLSCYVWNHNQQLEIARKVKENYPQCIVVCGGPHIPRISDNYFSKYPFVDILVHDEGEIPVKNLLLEFLKSSPDLSDINGITYNVDKKAVKTKASEKLDKNLPVPSPYLTGLFNSFFNSQESVNKIALWETNRGCPFSCCFCDWGVRTANKLRCHSMERVTEEIEYFGENQIEDIYISDANFGILKRDLDIAKLLVKCKEKYGFPKRIRVQFAKKSNKTVFQISKLLFDNHMLWGTTLSMQSVDMTVLEAIKRPHVSLENYKKAKDLYREHNIPTYTELILGLPMESKESLVHGICTLFDIGMHDDFRMFELVLLPNAPLSDNSLRDKFGLHTKMKPVRLVDSGCEKEYVELVFGSNTMSHEDWEYCFVFSEMTQAIHNGGYTRFLSIYLNEQGILSYKDFYTALLDHMLLSDKKCFTVFARIKKLINDFYNDPDMPQINRALTQPDIKKFLKKYNPDRKGWQLWTYIWLWINEYLDDFYDELVVFLKTHGVSIDNRILDLIKYQKEIMLTLDYDPLNGKQAAYDFNWYDYFMRDNGLRKEPVVIKYQDQKMGASFQYELEMNNKKKFVTAAIGFSYPYSKFRHFFHQFESAKIET
jgi:putative methyltransferase